MDALVKITDATTYPTDTLGSKVYDVSGVTIAAGGEDHQITFDSAVAVSAGAKFGVTIEPDAIWSVSGTNTLQWRTNTSAQGGSFSGTNAFSAGNGAGWFGWSTLSGGRRYIIEIYGTATSAVPAKATTPVPADDAVSIIKNQLTTGWADGGGTDDFDVYFGVQGSTTLRVSGQAGISWVITDTLLYNTVYEWRIDSNNSAGTTTGDTWLFTILVFDPPLPTGITLAGSGGPNGEGTPTGDASGENNIVTIRKLIAVANNKFWIEDIP